MAAKDVNRITPLTGKADRADPRVRLIEEAVLLVRGEWPAVADGLCESVNRAAGLLFVQARELDEAIRRTAEEAARVVERLYGADALRALRAAATGTRPAFATHGAANAGRVGSGPAAQRRGPSLRQGCQGLANRS
jgi:hypothetical protein